MEEGPVTRSKSKKKGGNGQTTEDARPKKKKEKRKQLTTARRKPVILSKGANNLLSSNGNFYPVWPVAMLCVTVFVLSVLAFFALGTRDATRVQAGVYHRVPLTVGLVVMAKNENRTILRLLESAVGHVQVIVVCDTGSDDGTIQTVETFRNRTEKGPSSPRVLLYRHEWKEDFALNRNMCFEAARDGAPEMDYIFTVDADEVMKVNDPEWRRKIPYDHNLIAYEGNNHHPLPRLVNARKPFKYICVIHEIIANLPKATSGTFYGISIVNHADGHSSEGNNRHDRNFRLLKRGLNRGKEDECHARYVFYTAEALYEKGDYANSTLWHQTRLLLGGYKEEIYHSMYKMGLGMRQLGGIPTNISGVFLQAYEYMPWRAEALYYLAHMHNDHRNYENCRLFAEKAVMPFPQNDRLFVQRGIYAWQASDLAGFCCFHTRDWAAARHHWRNALEGIGRSNVDKIKMLKNNIALCESNLAPSKQIK